MTAIGPQVRIRDLRAAHNLTLVELAERIAEHGVTVDPDSLSNIERGNKRASDRLMHAWAKALRISPLDVTQPYKSASKGAA